MKTLYLTGSSANIWVDPETDEVGKLESEEKYDIRGIYYIEEIDAKKGEILLVFYDNKYNKFVLDTIRTKQWVANIRNRRNIEQKEKEEWAKKNANGPACDNLCEVTCCGDCKGC